MSNNRIGELRDDILGTPTPLFMCFVFKRTNCCSSLVISCQGLGGGCAVSGRSFADPVTSVYDAGKEFRKGGSATALVELSIFWITGQLLSLDETPSMFHGNDKQPLPISLSLR